MQSRCWALPVIALCLLSNFVSSGSSDEVAIGIDLGTTMSVVSVYTPSGGLQVLENLQGHRLTPSMVSFYENELLVGNAALNQLKTNPQHTFFGVKRVMGLKFVDDTVKKEARNLPFPIVECRTEKRKEESYNGGLLGKIASFLAGGGSDDHHAPSDKFKGFVCVDIDTNHRKMHVPVEFVSASVLRYLKEVAERRLGRVVTKAVVTVPAYFGETERKATIVAANMAGFEVLRLLNEPTAAAFSYAINSDKFEGKETIVVFDFGGGTLDVSILRITDGKFSVLATAGNNHLGGEDLDEIMTNAILEDFNKKHMKNASKSAKSRAKARSAAKSAKEMLSFSLEVVVSIDALFEGIDLEARYSRSFFEQIGAAFFDKVRPVIEKAFDGSGLTPKQIDNVLMVGGTSRIPIVRRIVESYFGQIPSSNLNMDESIAEGAALMAHRLINKNVQPFFKWIEVDTPGSLVKRHLTMESRLSQTEFTDIIPRSLGVGIDGDAFSIILKKFSTLPAIATDTYTTAQDYQTTVTFPVYEGDDPVASRNSLLGKFVLDGIQIALRGVPHFETTFSIDENGILLVTAIDLATKSNKSISLSNVNLAHLSGEEMAVYQKKVADHVDGEKKRHGDL